MNNKFITTSLTDDLLPILFNNYGFPCDNIRAYTDTIKPFTYSVQVSCAHEIQIEDPSDMVKIVDKILIPFENGLKNSPALKQLTSDLHSQIDSLNKKLEEAKKEIERLKPFENYVQIAKELK